MITGEKALQDQLPANSPNRQCFGCGADNDHGLRIKSYWEGDEVVCRWTPRPHHNAIGLPSVCGGVTATLLDCHSLWTVQAHVCRERGLSVEHGDLPPYLTRSLKVDYLRPAPLDRELVLRARVTKMGNRSATIVCSLYADDLECARAETVAVLAKG